MCIIGPLWVFLSRSYVYVGDVPWMNGSRLRLLCLPLPLSVVIDFLRHRHLSRRLHYKYGFEIFFIYILSFKWLLFLTWGCPWQFKRFLFTFYLFNDSCFYLVGVRASSLTIYGKERKTRTKQKYSKTTQKKNRYSESNNVERSSDLVYEFNWWR